MLNFAWVRMAFSLLLVAASIGHLMQNGDAILERVFGVEANLSGPRLSDRVFSSDWRLAEVPGPIEIPGTDPDVRRMLSPGHPGIAIQPGLDLSKAERKPI